MQTIRFVVSLWSVLIIAFAAAPALSQDANGKQPAKPPAAQPNSDADGRPARAKTEAEKAAARAKAEARKQKRLEDAEKRQTDAYLAQVQALDLTAAQKAEVEALAAKQHEWKRANSARIVEINQEIIAARGSGDVATVKSLTEDMQKLVRSRPELQDILTPDQREKLAAQAATKARAAREKANLPAPAAGQKTGAAEVESLNKRIKDARRDGDEELVQKLETELYMIKEAVRKSRAKEAAAKKAAGK